MDGVAVWFARVALGALLLSSACGSSDDDGGGGKAGTSGSAGSAGSGTGGSSGSGGASSCCPDVAPTDAEACGCNGASCTWVDCAVGRTTASCESGSWNVSIEPCAAFDCGGTECGPDQICIEKQGGALLYECADNPCGTGPLTCACAAAACSGTCVGVFGTTVTCNTCTSGICP